MAPIWSHFFLSKQSVAPKWSHFGLEVKTIGLKIGNAFRIPKVNVIEYVMDQGKSAI